jgi:hypothetical protein
VYPKLLYTLYGDVLTNRGLIHFFIQQHLETIHPTEINKSVDFYKEKK